MKKGHWLNETLTIDISREEFEDMKMKIDFIYNKLNQSSEVVIEQEDEKWHIIKKKVAEFFEGRELKAYKDTVGKWTIGIGKNFDDVPFTKEEESMIRNRLNDYTKNIKTLVIENGITDEECDILYYNSAKIAEKDAKSLISNFDQLTKARQIALIDFSFNVGYNTLKSFVNTRAAIERNDFERAYKGFRNSKWYGQVGRRSPIISNIIRSGEFTRDFASQAGFLNLL